MVLEPMNLPPNREHRRNGSRSRETRGLSWLLTGCLCSLVSCGGKGADRTASDGSVDAAADPPGVALSCPEAPPSGDEACAEPNLTCEFGADPRFWCRLRATCQATAEGRLVWALSDPSCDPLPDVTCPDEFRAGTNETCTAPEAWCPHEGDLWCHCSNCFWGGPTVQCFGDPIWQCQEANRDPKCPPVLPLLGSACAESSSDTTCDYPELGDPEAPTCGDVAVSCTQGVWNSAPPSCLM